MSAADELRATLARILPPSWTALVAGDDREGLDEMIAATDPAEVSELVRMVARDGWLVPEWPCELGGRALGATKPWTCEENSRGGGLALLKVPSAPAGWVRRS